MQVLRKALADGTLRACIDGEPVDLAEGLPGLDPHKKHRIDVVVDRIVIPADDAGFANRAMDSVETALRLGNGVVEIQTTDRTAARSGSP